MFLVNNQPKQKKMLASLLEVLVEGYFFLMLTIHAGPMLLEMSTGQLVLIV